MVFALIFMLRFIYIKLFWRNIISIQISINSKFSNLKYTLKEVSMLIIWGAYNKLFKYLIYLFFTHVDCGAHALLFLRILRQIDIFIIFFATSEAFWGFRLLTAVDSNTVFSTIFCVCAKNVDQILYLHTRKDEAWHTAKNILTHKFLKHF